MKAQLISWEQIRLDCKYPKDDNNNGYIYGLHLLDKDNIIDVIFLKKFSIIFEKIISICHIL